jgi:hypothetical protein
MVTWLEEDLDEESRSRVDSAAGRVMERRRAERIKQRLTCELIIGDRRHPGIVLDISETGLFVQTSASPPPGERARLDPQAANPSSSSSSQGSAYCFRVKQTSGPRSRTLRITAASGEEAKAAASAELDEGWEILAVDPVAA